MTFLSDRCHKYHNSQVVWTYVGQMISFHIVEKHKPNHVLRQFSMLQMSPTFSFTDPTLHEIDLRGKHNQDWCRIHVERILQFDNRKIIFV